MKIAQSLPFDMCRLQGEVYHFRWETRSIREDREETNLDLESEDLARVINTGLHDQVVDTCRLLFV